MQPSVGRIVHYTSLGDSEGKFPSEVQAALITKVNQDDTVALSVFYTTGTFHMLRVPKTDAVAGQPAARGHWNWPERI